MTAELAFINQHVQLKIEQIIKLNKKALWPFFTTTEGFKQWFPEIHASELLTKNELRFDVNGIIDHLPLITYDVPNTMCFVWSEARVKFDLRDIGNNMSELTFTERAPYTFPDLLRDLTGWTLKLDNLKAAAEQRPYAFNQEKFDQVEASYHQQLVDNHFYE